MRLNRFRSFKGRKVEEGQVVKVYKNLHNGLWSIKDKKSGLVLGHAEVVVLENAKFTVSQKGRERVLREKQKNIHAFIVGEFKGTESDSTKLSFSHVGVTYNPYKDTHFTLQSNRTYKLDKADKVVLTKNSVFANIL